jgi:hypothetical protein
MSKQFRFRINVECDVQNADSESVARTAAFALLTQMQSEKKRGRPSSDVKATITGVSIAQPNFPAVMSREPLPMKPRSLDESKTTIDEVTE